MFVQYSREAGADTGGLADDYFDNCHLISNNSSENMDDLSKHRKPHPEDEDGNFLEGFDDESLIKNLRTLGFFDGNISFSVSR